jgi:putative spermidine/putrescine transport system permease protein
VISDVVFAGARSGAAALWRRLQSRQGYLLLLIPGVVYLLFFFAYPIGNMLSRSVTLPGSGALTTRFYERMLREPVYLRVFLITFEIALEVTLLTLLLAYPLAYFLARLRPRVTNVLLIMVILPFFTSALVRTYAWIVLLGNQGMLNQALAALHVPGAPFRLLYNRTGVLIGMSYILLPYMILALYSVMRGIDRGLLQAAASVGASPMQAFRRVFLPLSLPGVAAGSLLTFILGLGFFITPALMGGARDTMIAMIIEQQVEQLLDWNFASALSAVLLAVTAVGFLAYDRIVGMERLFEAKR